LSGLWIWLIFEEMFFFTEPVLSFLLVVEMLEHGGFWCSVWVWKAGIKDQGGVAILVLTDLGWVRGFDVGEVYLARSAGF